MIAYDSYLNFKQKLYLALCKYLSLAYKEAFYFHVPGAGKRMFYERYLAKAMDISSGRPDLMIPKPSGSYCALTLELKIKPNITSKQKKVLEQLETYSRKTAVCYDFEEGKEVIDERRSLGDVCLGACGAKKKQTSYARC